MLWTAIQEKISSVFELETKIKQEITEFQTQVQLKREAELKKQAEEIVVEKKKGQKELDAEYAKAKNKASKLKFISWNVLSFNLIVDVPDTTENQCQPAEKEIYSCRNLGNPFPVYKSNLQIGEEKRMTALRNWLINLTIRTKTDPPDFICLQQVTKDFLQFYTIQGPKADTYNLVWDSPFSGIYAKERVNSNAKLYFAGEQGTFLLWNTLRFTLESSGVYGTPLAYFFGTGDVQLFCQFERMVDKSKLLVASMNAYPLSWSLIYAPTKLTSTADDLPLTIPETQPTSPAETATIIALTFRKPIILKILKKGIPNHLLTGKFDAKQMAFVWFPRESLGEDRDYTEEEKPCEIKNLCNSQIERYPVNCIDRYRFFLYTAPKGQEFEIEAQFNNLTYHYLVETIFSVDTNISPLIDGNLWSFNPTKNLLLMLDVIYVAETQCLFYNERLNYYLKLPIPAAAGASPVATPPTPTAPTPEAATRELLAAVSFGYDVTRTRLLNFVTGKMAPWIQHVKDLGLSSTAKIASPPEKKTETEALPVPPTVQASDLCVQQGIEMFSTFKETYKSKTDMTWWVPQYSEECDKTPRVIAPIAVPKPTPPTQPPGAAVPTVPAGTVPAEVEVPPPTPPEVVPNLLNLLS